MKVNNFKKNISEKAKIKLTVMDHKVKSEEIEVELLVDSGVNKTLLSEKDWKKVKPKLNGKPATLKKSHRKFSPFGTEQKVPMLGRTKCQMVAKCGRQITTMVYVVKGKSQSLLGLRDGKALGIISIDPEGSYTQMVGRVMDIKKAEVVKQGVRTREASSSIVSHDFGESCET